MKAMNVTKQRTVAGLDVHKDSVYFWKNQLETNK